MNRFRFVGNVGVNNMRRPTKRVLDLVDEISEAGIPVRFHISKRQVPMLVVKDDYSVAFFGNTNTYRIFYPFPSKGRHVTRTTVPTSQDVVKFFLELPYETIKVESCDICLKHVKVPHYHPSLDLARIQDLMRPS
ncbi:hypothetical protein LCGC14_3037470 [marine sediment metagenome]|uniref:Uncharacterized protein n=1 Tax=marine sediment metagenome TaxID=412755 RepID=A0A0F8YYK1_9ZZZZ